MPETNVLTLDWEDAIVDTVECPMCSGEFHPDEVRLGTLGTRDHFRCQYCGAQWDAPATQ